MMLHDFIIDNNLKVANFEFEQPVGYTYWNGSRVSYIDHVFVSSYAMHSVESCTIMSDVNDNISDHHPIKTVISVSVSSDNISDNIASCNNSVPVYPRVNWSDHHVRLQYQQCISQYCDI